MSTQTECVFEHSLHLKYLLFLPQGYGEKPDKKWPLILFLHGMGERGDDLELVKIHGMAKLVEQQPDLPFIVVSPQCPDDCYWWDLGKSLMALLDELVSQYAVDERRIYLTGLSLGGYGTWGIASANPGRFAAIVPICGGGFAWSASLLADVPIWAFHGDQDDLVDISESQRMVDAVRQCGGDVRFTVYPGVGHDSWTQTYENPELFRWLLEHSR